VAHPPLPVALRRLGLAGALVAAGLACAAPAGAGDVAGDAGTDFKEPPEAARPWAFWYWMNAAVSPEGLTADLEAMKQAGLGGVYLMPIRGATDPPQWEPPLEQLTPQWWDAVLHAFREADRLGLRIAMHASDGFALAGGPWITPELSMQRIVWTETRVEGGRRFAGVLPQPPTREGYYRDIAVYAFRPLPGAGQSTRTVVPVVTTSEGGLDASFLTRPGHAEPFRCRQSCWIQYAFAEPFTCRSVTVLTPGNNHTYHANRLSIEVSDDGEHFRTVGRLQPPRHGWQDGDAPVTHALPPVTARVFRFVHDPTGFEPGNEDLDSAKWAPELQVQAIVLSGEPRIHQFEGKSGAVWRIGRWTTREQVPDEASIPLDQIVNLTDRLDADGRLEWDVPEGQWTVLRMGHTSTGHRNETGGGGKGLECDKFDPEAVRTQFTGWFGEALRRAGPELAPRVLSTFHVDSWECSSQNWSRTFRREFERRRGYDPLRYLPAMAGIPVESADVSERFLHDVRETIAELVVDVFYGTLRDLTRERGIRFTAENVAPTMTSDGMLHFQAVDVPMGEFWLRSPTHDKPNDMLDAICGAHVYGRPVVQAEAFTELRLAWDEYPAMLKAWGDFNYALGINRFVYHVMTHNPWVDRRPGMTLSDIGLFFQRDQTWWSSGRAFVDYARRVQALLQRGHPVVDVAVFTGEEVPRRAVLPERLIRTLPGILGADAVEREKARLRNHGEPLEEGPRGVVHSANLPRPVEWRDPLRGYAYDSINRDALLRLATVRDGRIELPGGASYALLVLPAARPMSPEGDRMTPEVAARLRELVSAGATILVDERPTASPSLSGGARSDEQVRAIAGELWPGTGPAQRDATIEGSAVRRVGEGRVVQGPYRGESFVPLGIAPDVVATEEGRRASGLAWAHREEQGTDIYFLSNQEKATRNLEVSLRACGRWPELWDAVTEEMRRARVWRIEGGRTRLPVRLASAGSVFVLLREPTAAEKADDGRNWTEPQEALRLDGGWRVSFDPRSGGPADPLAFDGLVDWTQRAEPGVKCYSGTAAYERTFAWRTPAGGARRVWLSLGRVANIAEVAVNGVPCGVAWTAPYRVEITSALKDGDNRLRVDVTNTWRNRLIGDLALPESERLTWTTASSSLVEGRPLLEAGLLGPVTVEVE
jgi:hypothetical protein